MSVILEKKSMMPPNQANTFIHTHNKYMNYIGEKQSMMPPNQAKYSFRPTIKCLKPIETFNGTTQPSKYIQEINGQEKTISSN